MVGDREQLVRAWLKVVCAIGGVAFGAVLVATRHGVQAWPTVALYAGLLLLAGTVAFELPSRLIATPSSVIILAAIPALPAHDRLLGSMLVAACEAFEWKRLRARRFLIVGFNASQLAVAALATAAVYQASPFGAPLTLIVTAAAHLLVNNALVLPAVAIQSEKPLSAILADIRGSAVTDPAFSVLGLLLGRAYHAHGLVVVLLVAAPAVVARTVLLSVARFRHAYGRLESLYEFTRELEASREDPDAAATMLGNLSARLGVRSAQVLVRGNDGWQRSWLHGGTLDVDGGPGAAPLDPLTTDAALAADLPAGSALARELAQRDMADGMLAPLQIDNRRVGVVAVSGTVNQRALTGEDLRLLETFANHIAVFLERNRLVERLRHDSTHDQLTGLPNRSHFNELITRAARPTAILLVDLDRFKEVNDTLGHGHGDLLLQSVAARLSAQFDGATVARLGGDEFGILLPATASGDAVPAAVGLLTSLEQPFSIGTLDLEVTASVGVAVAGDRDDPTKLLAQADVAMYAAKAAHSGWEVYTPTRDHYSPWRLSLASDLRRGITADELEVHFQPKATVADGVVRGVEALVRWRHPRYGLLSPDQFVPVAEQAGLIRPLTMAVLAAACEQKTRLDELGFPLGIAINLSVRSVLDVNLPDQIADVLDANRVDPASLTLEITEGSLMADPGRTIGILGRLASLGIRISIDDFGTGYSSLGYLKRLPATEVKIDRSFVSNLLTSTSDAAIVRSTVDLAHNLGLRAVAEGIEDPETWAALAQMGCDEGQGYFLSAPLTAEALLPWLLRTRSADPHP